MQKFLFPAAALAAGLGIAFMPFFPVSSGVWGRETPPPGVATRPAPQESEKNSEIYRYFAGSQEPSEESERLYMSAIAKWLEGLSPDQAARARAVIAEVHPELSAMRAAIRDKKNQLVHLSFGRDTPPETLPRLGQELQELRDKLAARLKDVEQRLKTEAGVSLETSDKDGFWLSPPAGIMPD